VVTISVVHKGKYILRQMWKLSNISQHIRGRPLPPSREVATPPLLLYITTITITLLQNIDRGLKKALILLSPSMTD
jgi:hypothetical protein